MMLNQYGGYYLKKKRRNKVLPPLYTALTKPSQNIFKNYEAEGNGGLRPGQWRMLPAQPQRILRKPESPQAIGTLPCIITQIIALQGIIFKLCLMISFFNKHSVTYSACLYIKLIIV